MGFRPDGIALAPVGEGVSGQELVLREQLLILIQRPFDSSQAGIGSGQRALRTNLPHEHRGPGHRLLGPLAVLEYCVASPRLLFGSTPQLRFNVASPHPIPNAAIRQDLSKRFVLSRSVEFVNLGQDGPLGPRNLSSLLFMVLYQA